MTDLATLHKTARSLILSIREGLETLEKADEQVMLHQDPCHLVRPAGADGKQ